ncbi:MAG: PIN domain-containing protein [Asticcacaulis sp.]
MIGIDTNVLVRYIVQDNLKQWQAASQFIDALHGDMPGFVSQVVVAELVWVLTTIYDLKRADVADTLSDLLQSRETCHRPSRCRQPSRRNLSLGQG